jgi:creatinine amidohydrolase
MTPRHAARWLAPALALALSAAAPAQAAPPPSAAADMTWMEFEAAAREGAVALWALGAMEEHGPHLPLDTDVIIPTRQLERVRDRLAERGVRSVTLPTYAWGVNHVTSAFPGSIQVRPQVMTELMVDVFESLARAGFKEAYCITGHYDAAHSRAILEAVRRANAQGRIRVRYVAPEPLGRRLGLEPGGPDALLARFPPLPTARPFADLHAGAGETSAVLHIAPDKVRRDLTTKLAPTDLSDAQVAAWRQGGEAARAITPHGYLGAPAEATPAEGAAKVLGEADAYAEAILAARARPGR